MFDIVKEIRRFADEDSDSIGRDVLRRELHRLADRVQESFDAIVAHYQHKVARQAASMAATSNVRLRDTICGVDMASKPSETVYHVSSYSPEMGWWCEYLGPDETEAKKAYKRAKEIYDNVTIEKERKCV